MYSKLKKILLLLGITFLVWGANTAWADTQEALVIKVSISNSKSFTLDKSTWNFGALTADSTSVSTAAITVTNASGGITQTYQLQYSTPTVSPSDWFAGSSWGTSTAEQFVLGAQFSTNQPADADGSWASDIVQTTLTACSSTVHGNGTPGESGASVPDTGVRSLWFRIETPATTANPASHDIYVMLSIQ